MYNGFYINLAANHSRRDALIHRLQTVGAASRYQRVEAINGREVASQYASKLDPGNLGLWVTHVNLVRSQLGSNAHLHIIEDDTTLATNAVALFDQTLKHADTNLPDWDLIFTDIVPPLGMQIFDLFHKAVAKFHQSGNITMAPLNQIMFAGTGSLFIRRQSIQKYLSLMDRRWEANKPIDIYLRQIILQGQLKAYLTLPFLTSPTPQGEQSDIRGSLTSSRLVMDLYRRSFFKDADLTSINEQIKHQLAGTKLNYLPAIYLNTLGFVLSDKWEPF